MLKNNIIKKMMLAMIVLVIFGNNLVYALPVNGGLPSDAPSMYEGAGPGNDRTYEEWQFDNSELNSWINSFKPSALGEEATLKEKAGAILAVVNVIGVVSSVICLMILGIKYMLGSVEEKADYKNAMIPYLIGAILVFSATTLPNIIYQIVQNM